MALVSLPTTRGPETECRNCGEIYVSWDWGYGYGDMPIEVSNTHNRDSCIRHLRDLLEGRATG